MRCEVGPAAKGASFHDHRPPMKQEKLQLSQESVSSFMLDFTQAVKVYRTPAAARHTERSAPRRVFTLWDWEA